MLIAVEYLTEPGMALLRAEHQVVPYDDSMTDAQRNEVVCLVIRKKHVSAAEMDRFPKLRFIVKRGVGMDRIDLDAARERGLVVCNSGTANVQSVVELGVGLLLAICRRIPQIRDIARTTGYVFPPLPEGVELYGKKVGIMGLGAIGRGVARTLGAGFGMKVSAYSPSAPDSAFAEVGASRVDSLGDLFADNDVLFVCTPLTKHSRMAVNAEILARCKPSAFLVVVSRGNIVDEVALQKALQEGRLAGAASDVFAEEPLRTDHPLLKLDNFIGVPHIGGSTREAWVRGCVETARETLRLLNGEAPLYRVV